MRLVKKLFRHHGGLFLTSNFIMNSYFLPILRHLVSFIFRLISFEILSFLPALCRDKCRLITRDLYTLEKIIRNFRTIGYRKQFTLFATEYSEF